MRVVAIIMLALASACAGSLESRVLNVLDVSSDLALQTCDARKKALADAHEPEKLEQAIERCDRVFDSIATATDMVESGKLKDAEESAREVVKLVRELRGAK